jgi:hypothetical protein
MSITEDYNQGSSAAIVAKLVLLLAEATDFSLLQSVQTGSVAHLASYTVETWGFSQKDKVARSSVAHPPYSAEVRIEYPMGSSP